MQCRGSRGEDVEGGGVRRKWCGCSFQCDRQGSRQARVVCSFAPLVSSPSTLSTSVPAPMCHVLLYRLLTFYMESCSGIFLFVWSIIALKSISFNTYCNYGKKIFKNFYVS